MNKRKPIQIAQPTMGEEEWLALREPVESGWLTQGPKVAAFEEAFANRHGVKHALATTSCTTALHLALLAVGVKPGEGVIVPSFTWVATANAVEYCGAVPVFCDIDPITYNMDPASAEHSAKKAMDKGLNLSAIIPVHLFGLCADMEPILKIATEFNLKVVEDAACASGSSYRGNSAGTLGDVGCFSFHPRKVLVTGEGGMCTTNDSEKAEMINCLRNHGATLSEEQRHHSNAPYLMPDFNILGYNYRMTDLQGALGLVQLSRLDGFIVERQKKAAWYTEQLKDISWLQTPVAPPDYSTNWQAYVCSIKEGINPLKRDELLAYLHQNGISSRVGTQAVHMLGYYREKYNIKEEDYPVSRNAYYNCLALPLHNGMSDEDYEYIVNILKTV